MIYIILSDLQLTMTLRLLAEGGGKEYVLLLMFLSQTKGYHPKSVRSLLSELTYTHWYNMFTSVTCI